MSGRRTGTGHQPPAGFRDLAEVVQVYQTEAADAAAFHRRTAAAGLAGDTAACDEAVARCDARAALLAELVDGRPVTAEAAAGGGPALGGLAEAAAALAAPPPTCGLSDAAAVSRARTAAFSQVCDALKAARTPEELEAADAAYGRLRGGGGDAGRGRGDAGAPAPLIPPPAVRTEQVAPGLWAVDLPGGAPGPPPGPRVEL